MNCEKPNLDKNTVHTMPRKLLTGEEYKVRLGWNTGNQSTNTEIFWCTCTSVKSKKLCREVPFFVSEACSEVNCMP